MSNQWGHMRNVELIRFIVLFTFFHGGNRSQQRGGGGGGHFDVESSTFKGKIGTLMWPSSTLMLAFNTLFCFLAKIILFRSKSIVVFVSVPERLAGSLPDRWPSSLL